MEARWYLPLHSRPFSRSSSAVQIFAMEKASQMKHAENPSTITSLGDGGLDEIRTTHARMQPLITMSCTCQGPPPSLVQHRFSFCAEKEGTHCCKHQRDPLGTAVVALAHEHHSVHYVAEHWQLVQQLRAVLQRGMEGYGAKANASHESQIHPDVGRCTGPQGDGPRQEGTTVGEWREKVRISNMAGVQGLVMLFQTSTTYGE